VTDLIALHHEYENRMLEGGAFDQIEAEIDARDDLDQDEKAALWLCAWARVPAARQRKTARQFTDLVADGYRTVGPRVGPGKGEAGGFRR
jgi:hypothetical protein